jgi:hypothetical protein
VNEEKLKSTNIRFSLDSHFFILCDLIGRYVKDPRFIAPEDDSDLREFSIAFIIRIFDDENLTEIEITSLSLFVMREIKIRINPEYKKEMIENQEKTFAQCDQSNPGIKILIAYLESLNLIRSGSIDGVEVARSYYEKLHEILGNQDITEKEEILSVNRLLNNLNIEL